MYSAAQYIFYIELGFSFLLAGPLKKRGEGAASDIFYALIAKERETRDKPLFKNIKTPYFSAVTPMLWPCI